MPMLLTLLYIHLDDLRSGQNCQAVLPTFFWILIAAEALSVLNPTGLFRALQGRARNSTFGLAELDIGKDGKVNQLMRIMLVQADG